LVQEKGAEVGGKERHEEHKQHCFCEWEMFKGV
jgi:hypothetical protein